MAAAGETDVCGICLETLPRWGGDGVTWFPCCGKVMHNACAKELQASAHGDKCHVPRPCAENGARIFRMTLKLPER